MPTPQHLRVFLASPSDVADERALARRLLKDVLPYDPLLRGYMTFDVVSWDDPTARTPMPARLTPQEAVIRFETKPSDCDVVLVILWSRLGTHLDLMKFQKPNGDLYLSGTEWEYEDACKGKSEIFIYRRTEVPKVDLNDPDYEEKRRQYQLDTSGNPRNLPKMSSQQKHGPFNYSGLKDTAFADITVITGFRRCPVGPAVLRAYLPEPG